MSRSTKQIATALSKDLPDEEGLPLSAMLLYIRSRSTEDCGCWLWSGAVSDSGVPTMHRDTGLKKPNGWTLFSTLPVRRAIVEEVAAGPMPERYVSALLCEQPLCVNPYHVARTTKAVQAAVAAKRGAWSSPQKTAAITLACRAKSRFSEEVIEYVRTSTKSGKELAAEVGMSVSHACNIRLGRVRASPSPFAGLM